MGPDDLFFGEFRPLVFPAKENAGQQGADPPEDDCLDTKTAGCSIMSSEMGSSESGMDQSEENEDKKAEEDLKNEIYVCCFIGCGYRCREKIL